MRPGLTATAVLLLVVLIGCGGDDEPDDEPDAEGSTPPPVATWNPCDALDLADVSRWFGSELAKDSGTDEAPECTFTPQAEGDPVVNANYLQFAGGLDDAFDSMGLDPDDVREVRVAQADAARVVVDFDDTQLFVSGFVQNGDLIQTVDVVDPRPFDEARSVRAVRSVLTALSAAAP